MDEPTEWVEVEESIPMNAWIMQIKWNTLLYLRKKPLTASYHSPVFQMMTTHMQSLWKTVHMQTMGDYHDLYLKTDVLLLADVFENFRKKCLEYYELDPAHYYTAPGLSWDAALKLTKVNLELLDDIEMHLMVEKGNCNNFLTVASIITISTNTVYSKCTVLFSGVRGGVSTISTKYCKANNRFMQYYDEKEKITYILDLDANNLYGKQHKIL